MRLTSGHVHVRVATRRNSDGTPVRYLQLAHNEWDAATKTSRPRVLYSFGREDSLDRTVIERLVAVQESLAATLGAVVGGPVTPAPPVSPEDPAAPDA